MTEEQKRAIVQAGRRCERELRMADIAASYGDDEVVHDCLEQAAVDSYIAFCVAGQSRPSWLDGGAEAVAMYLEDMQTGCGDGGAEAVAMYFEDVQTGGAA